MRRSSGVIAKTGSGGGDAAAAAEPPDAYLATVPARRQVLVEGFTVPQVHSLTSSKGKNP